MKFYGSYGDIVWFAVSVLFSVFHSHWGLIVCAIQFAMFFRESTGIKVFGVSWEKDKGWSIDRKE